MANAKPIKMKAAKTELQTTDGVTLKLATEDGTKLQVVQVAREVAPGIKLISYELKEQTQ